MYYRGHRWQQIRNATHHERAMTKLCFGDGNPAGTTRVPVGESGVRTGEAKLWQERLHQQLHRLVEHGH